MLQKHLFRYIFFILVRQLFAWHMRFSDEAADTSMGVQVQARRWLAKLFQQPLPDFPLSILLENGYVL